MGRNIIDNAQNEISQCRPRDEFDLSTERISNCIIDDFTTFCSVVREITPTIMGIFSFQVLIVVCVGFLAWFWVLSVYPASDMASFGFLAPLFSVFFGWLILDEHITLRFVVALAFVCIGIILVNRKPAQS